MFICIYIYIHYTYIDTLLVCTYMFFFRFMRVCFLCIPVISMTMYSIIVYRYTCNHICATYALLRFEITPDSADLVQLLLDARPVDVVVLQAHPGSAKQC